MIKINTCHLNPFSTSNYPLKPVNTSLEIRNQLYQIDDIQNNGKEIFAKIAETTIKDNFTKPTEENLKVL